MTNELALTQTSDINRIERMAQAVAKSGLFGLKTPDQAMALMLVAESEGRHPASAAKDYHIINNNPSKKAEAMLRDFLLAGGKVEWHSLDDRKADATFSHPAGGTARIDWTLERAAQAGLTNNPNWKKYPRAMLRSRVVSEGVRTIYPAATSGMYVPEEVQDFEPHKKSKSEPVKEAIDVESRPVTEMPLLDQCKIYADLLKLCFPPECSSQDFETIVLNHVMLMDRAAKEEVALHKRLKEIIQDKRKEFREPAKGDELGDEIPHMETEAEKLTKQLKGAA